MISVTIATNMNVSNAMKISVRDVFRMTELSVNASIAINSIAGNAMKMMKMMNQLVYSIAVDAMSNSNVAMIVFSKGIDRNNSIAQNVSIGVWRWSRA